MCVSDLLIRHERLSHGKDGPQKKLSARSARNSTKKANSVGVATATYAAGSSPMSQPSVTPYATVHNGSMHPGLEANNDYSLATLSTAAEYAALQIPYGSSCAQNNEMSPQNTPTLTQDETMMRINDSGSLLDGQASSIDFEHSLDQLASFLDNGCLSSYHVSSLMNVEQPMPFFSPESLPYANEVPQEREPDFRARFEPICNQTDETGTFSRFGSRLPSLQPEEPQQISADMQKRSAPRRSMSEISFDDRKEILLRVTEFSSVVPESFQMPSRLALSRYIAGYINGFHEHLPFLHTQTMSIRNCSVELILAMAAVGTQYCFEGEKAVGLFHTSQAISMERIRRRDTKLASLHHQAESEISSPADNIDQFSSPHSSYQPSTGPLGLPPEPHYTDCFSSNKEDLIQTAQALLILMAMATWAKHREILREALALQSVLATLVRDGGLTSYPLPKDISWEDWIRAETVKRTKFTVYCFFNLHCIVYNIPSLILNSEVNLTLPCGAKEFKAPTAAKWQEARDESLPEFSFQEALDRLFSRGGHDIVAYNSSMGNYILIHAIIQHIFFLRQVSRGRLDGGRNMAPEDTAVLEQALRNWQIGWKRNPESSLDPQDPKGPVAFNSTALLRLAYIRLNIDIGPGRALDTRDPVQIARAFHASPSIKRTPKLVRAVLHSAHALSIPVKIGVRLVAQTQTFVWSIQHSLCSLECAFLLSKWLEALSVPNPDPPVSEDEKKIATLVKIMLEETEFAIQAHHPFESSATLRQLSAGVLRVWAKIFKGAQTWAIVDIIGSSLNIYADMLGAG